MIDIIVSSDNYEPPEWIAINLPELTKSHFCVVHLLHIEEKIQKLINEDNRELMRFVEFELYNEGKYVRFKITAKKFKFKIKVFRRLLQAIFVEDEYISKNYPFLKELKRDRDIHFINYNDIVIPRYGISSRKNYRNVVDEHYDKALGGYRLSEELFEAIEEANTEAAKRIREYILNQYLSGEYNESNK